MKAILLVTLCACSCVPVARVVEAPVAANHETLTAAEYGAAELAFSGELAPMPAELVAAADLAWCQRQLDQRDGFQWASIFGGTLAGGGGLVAALPDDASRDLRLGFGVTSALFAAGAAAFASIAAAKSARFEQRCATERTK